ncbi:MAG: hypothetical protein ACOZNI_33760 [Myxococcota bacterium]
MIVALIGCSEFAIRKEPEPPPADPPERDPDAAFGDPPDWTTCEAAWFGQYFNLSEPPEDVPDGAEDSALWETRAFSRRDTSLDHGASWWPVDEGLAGDPDYFTARWTAWLRVTGGDTMEVVLGAQTVAWLLVDGEEVLRVEGAEGLEVGSYTIPVETGQFPIELRFAQLVEGESGLRFRIAGLEGAWCYPDFSAP